MKPTVLLVDDHAIVREGLASLLTLSDDFGKIAQAADGAAAIEISASIAYDLIIIDLLMPNISGVDAIRVLRKTCPHASIIVLTSSDDDALAFTALDAGAQSFLLKSMSGEEILHALKQIAAGAHVIHSSITVRMLRMVRRADASLHNPFSVLTPRETEVLHELAQGASNAKIASALYITERTVKAHIGALLSKLGLMDRTEAVAFAWRNGLMAAGQDKFSGQTSR